MVRARLGDIQFFVYDARRGARESTELEKLLAVYPSVPDPTDLLWAVGLLQGLATFANTFGQASDWTRTETQRSVWLSVQAQPSISLGLALAKSAIPRHATEDGVQAILVLLRSLVATLHGGVQALLDEASEARLPKLHLGSPPRPFECLLLSMAPADLRVIVALDTSGGGCSKAQAAALHNLARPWLEPLIKEAALPPERPAHLPGYRYMAVREGLAGALASPRPKISAMSHVDRAMAAAGRDSMARQGALGAAADWTDADGGASRTSFREVLARAATGGSWLLMQESMQGHLLAVRQGAGEKTVKEIMPAVADLQRRLDLNA